MNGYLGFFFIEHRSDNVAMFVMLKEKWEIKFSASLVQDSLLPGNLEYHSSDGPPREQGNNLIRYVGSSLILVQEA